MIITEANYFSPEAEQEYMGSSQYREFCGTIGQVGCEARALAKIRGEWEEEKSVALYVGSYVDAHFSGTLGTFKAQNPEIFKKNGELKSEFQKANLMIARAERDKYFMKTLSGGTQVIFTAELFGLKWKVKLDSYHEKVAIVDGKTTKSIIDSHWVKDLGRISFVEYWGYNIQMAIYQKITELVTGDKLPTLLAAVSKEKEPDIEIIGFHQAGLDAEIEKIKLAAPRLIQLKAGEIEPGRCGFCDYCKSVKVLSKPIHYSELGFKV